MTPRPTSILSVFAALAASILTASAEPLVYEGEAGVGKGKHIVFIANDHEYRSEQTCPLMAKVLAKHHGFKCTVLFGIDEEGFIKTGGAPVPGMEVLKEADLLVFYTRFMNLPDEQAGMLADYFERGGPVVGIRTSTHCFNGQKGKWAKLNFNYTGEDYVGGLGEQIFGNTWHKRGQQHYGSNHVLGCAITPTAGAAGHSILTGVEKIHAYSGGYSSTPPEGSTPLLDLQVLNTFGPSDEINPDKPVVCAGWTRDSYVAPSGAKKEARVVYTSYGASEDLLSEGARRFLVNGSLWAIGLEGAIKPDLDVSIVGGFKPSPYTTGAFFYEGVKPSELAGWDSQIMPAGKKLGGLDLTDKKGRSRAARVLKSRPELAAELEGKKTSAAPATEKPNILFIMSDDHTAQAVGAYATILKSLDPTPTIDALAAEGMTFDNAFCTNGICTPSRACIITGQYPHVNGVFDLGGNITPENQALPILMREAGYQTAMVGKWHLKQEPNFDYYKVVPGQGKYYDTEFRVQGEKKWPWNLVKHEGEHSSDAITDSTLEWFKTKRDKNKPFFVCHQFKAPHDFFENAPRYQTYLKDVKIPEPPTLYDVSSTFGSIATRGHNDELMPHIGTSIGERNPRRSYAVDLLQRFPEEFPEGYTLEGKSEVETTRLAYQAYLKKYLRCVKGVDDNLKRLFDYLKAEGLYDNTVIIYTGDQGFWLGENDYQDKRWAYDKSMRMPFIVRYPKGVKAGVRSDAIVENVDYPALMLDYAGVEIPKTMQGRSFKAICETGEEPADWKKAAYYRYWMHMAHHDNPGEMAIRTKTHKLIYFYGANYEGGYQTPPAWELYDLVKDPDEQDNVYDDPAYAKVRDELKAGLAKLRKDIGDDGSHYPKCEAVVQEFWDYDEADRKKAIEISAQFKKVREVELVAAKAKAAERAKKKAAQQKKEAAK